MKKLLAAFLVLFLIFRSRWLRDLAFYALCALLSQDPRPHYHQDESRLYGFPFQGLEVRFRVEENTLIVCEIEKES